MRSCLNRLVAMLRSRARRCEPVTPSLRRPFVFVAILTPYQIRGLSRLADLHAERQAHVLQTIFDLVEGLLAEVLDREQLLVAAPHELADRADARDLQAVGGAARQLDHLDRLVEDLPQLRVDARAARGDVARGGPFPA